MGLGKSFSVITLLQTVARYPQLYSSRILILCPKSTVLNWIDEFKHWSLNNSIIEIFHFNDKCSLEEKVKVLEKWNRCNEDHPGCLIIGYEAFRILLTLLTAKNRRSDKCNLVDFDQRIRKCLLDGTEVVIADEGHMIKNSETGISKACCQIKTKRRIILTGTPIQNNLNEYFCMVCKFI
jgi:transcriptional regulator ATRX